MSNIEDRIGTEAEPRYFKLPHVGGGATQLWFIVCDEGWRQSIVAAQMYDWIADWIISEIQGKPFAPGLRP